MRRPASMAVARALSADGQRKAETQNGPRPAMGHRTAAEVAETHDDANFAVSLTSSPI